MSYLAELAQSQMLGLKGKPAWPDLGSEPNLLLNQVGEDATGLLRGCALLAVYEQAGALLPQHEEASPLLEALEPVVPLDQTTDQLIQNLILGKAPLLWKEWLGLLIERGQKIPTIAWPNLLQMACNQQILRPLLVSLASPRARWLARLNPDWAWLNETLEARVADWDQASFARRCELVTQLLLTDRNQALDLVVKSFAVESGPNRLKFLEILTKKAQPDLIPFLESLSKDRYQKVRKLAAQARCELCPDFAASITATLEPLVVKHTHFLSKDTFSIEPPEVFDPTWKAWGIEEKTGESAGQRAFWLNQLIDLAPLEWWSKFGKTPEDLFASAKQSPWFGPVRLGWLEAAGFQRNEPWLRCLLANHDSKDHQSLVMATRSSLVGRIDSSLCLRLGLMNFSNMSYMISDPLLAAVDQPIDPGEAVQAIKSLSKHVDLIKREAWRKDTIGRLALFLHPSSLIAFELFWDLIEPGAHDSTRQWLNIRHSFYQEVDLE